MGLGPWLQSLPAGLDTRLAAGGEALSALARAGWVVARTGPATAVAAAWADATEAGELA